MFTYWDVSEDEDSGYYGENGNPANSLHFEITDGTNGLGPTYGYVIRHNGEIVNSVPSTMFDDYFTAKDAMNEALPIDLLTSTTPDYDPSIYEKQGERKIMPKTSSMRKASAYEFIDDYTYGDPYEEQNTVTLDIEPDYGGYEATIYAPEYDPSITPEPLEGGSFTTEDEAIRWFRNTCESSERVKQKLDDNYEPPISSFIASANEDSLSDDLEDMNNDDLTEDDMVPDAIALRRDIRKSDRELVFWDRDIQLEMAFERYGIENDETHSLAISVSPVVDEYGTEGTDLGFDAVIQYPAYGFYGTADTVSADTVEGALELAEDFCLNHAMEYLNLSDVTSSKRTSGRTFKTAKRKWNARERLALINEEKLIDDEFDDLI